MARILHRAVVGLGVVGLLVTACAPGDEGDDAESAETPPASEPAEIDEEVTLIVWDQEVRGGQNEVIEELNAAFMEENPNITIERVSRSFEDLQTTLPLALTGDDAPDVVQANNGRPIMGSFVEAGLLVPLDDYAAQYEWTERFPESVLATGTAVIVHDSCLKFDYAKKMVEARRDKPPADEHERVLGRRRPPGALDQAKGVLEHGERGLPALAADLDVGGG